MRRAQCYGEEQKMADLPYLCSRQQLNHCKKNPKMILEYLQKNLLKVLLLQKAIASWIESVSIIAVKVLEYYNKTWQH